MTIFRTLYMQVPVLGSWVLPPRKCSTTRIHARWEAINCLLHTSVCFVVEYRRFIDVFFGDSFIASAGYCHL